MHQYHHASAVAILHKIVFCTRGEISDPVIIEIWVTIMIILTQISIINYHWMIKGKMDHFIIQSD